VYLRRIRLWDYLRRLNHGRTNDNTVHFRFTNILVLDYLLVEFLVINNIVLSKKEWSVILVITFLFLTAGLIGWGAIYIMVFT